MTIACKLCRLMIESSKPDAPEDLALRMSQHLKKAHHEQAQDLGMAFQVLTGLAFSHMLFKYVEIPESENAMRGAYDENRQGLYAMLEAELPPAGQTRPAKTGILN